MQNQQFNNRLRQIILLAIIILLILVLFNTLRSFLPGMLGAVTLYILTRGLYFQATMKHKWKKSLTAFLFIFVFLIIVAIPIYISVELVSPKINQLINNQDVIVNSLKKFSDNIYSLTGFRILSPDNVQSITAKVSAFVPQLLNSTANLLTNLLILFFIYYYMLISGREMEKILMRLVPLKRSNVDQLTSETKTLVRANALGIPIICAVQGVFATLGYWIFDIEDWGLWGFVTGVMAYFPLIGTMAVWVPLVIYQFATGDNFNAIGLMIYSIVVTGNVDYITRLGLMKKMGDVHPIITVMGVFVGLGLFGFIGLVFGPLLISYLFVLIKIYVNEFTDVEDI
jgi:predicted PurR-regulated permease PerM